MQRRMRQTHRPMRTASYHSRPPPIRTHRTYRTTPQPKQLKIRPRPLQTMPQHQNRTHKTRRIQTTTITTTNKHKQPAANHTNKHPPSHKNTNPNTKNQHHPQGVGVVPPPNRPPDRSKKGARGSKRFPTSKGPHNYEWKGCDRDDCNSSDMPHLMWQNTPFPENLVGFNHVLTASKVVPGIGVHLLMLILSGGSADLKAERLRRR